MTRALVAALLVASPALSVTAQTPTDPFPAPIAAVDGVIKVKFVEFASIPDIDGQAARMMLLVDEPGTRRMFVNDMRGPLYSVSYDGKTVGLYLDINAPAWGVSVQSQGQRARLPELRVSSAVQPGRHARLWQVLHLHRHQQHDAGARLQARRRHENARHGSARMDRQESGRRDIRWRTAARADSIRAAVCQPQRRPDQFQSARLTRRRRFRSAVRGLRRRRQRRRPAQQCRRISARSSARFCASTRLVRTAPMASTAFPPPTRSSATATPPRSARSTPRACAIHNAFPGIPGTATCSSPTSARTSWRRSVS